MPRIEMIRRRLGLFEAAAKEKPMATASHGAHALVPTDKASRYLQQVCKHWQHDMQVEFTPEKGTVIFPKDIRGMNHPGDAVVHFHAVEGGLEVWIDATSPEQLEALKGVVARHLDRFAFREGELAFDWR